MKCRGNEIKLYNIFIPAITIWEFSTKYVFKFITKRGGCVNYILMLVEWVVYSTGTNDYKINVYQMPFIIIKKLIKE